MQLSSGRTKKMKDLETVDFICSAKSNPDITLDHSTLVQIELKTTNGFQKVIDHFNWKDEKPESETILNDADYKTVPSTRVSACFSITLNSQDIPVTTYKQTKQRRSVSQFLCKAKYQLIEKFPDLSISINIIFSENIGDILLSLS